MSDGFVMELCGNRAAWQIDLEEIDSIDLDVVGARIESDGYEVGIRNRLCWTFTGPCDLTLYPSGKLLVKTENKDKADAINTRNLITGYVFFKK